MDLLKTLLVYMTLTFAYTCAHRSAYRCAFRHDGNC